MPTACRTIGGPGSGKTTRLLEIMEKCLDKVVSDPLRIGFVSFTRAARREASSRAASKFGYTCSDLETQGFFRTLHSCCYKLLGITKGELLVGGKDDTDWLQDAVGDDRVRLDNRNGNNLDDDSFCVPASSGDSAQALAFWDVARNSFKPVTTIWEKAYQSAIAVPPLETCHGVIARYETAKARDGRLDYCDLLMRYAGHAWTGDHTHPFARTRLEGDVPMLPVWIVDEAQDNSPLLWAVFTRLVQPATYVYLAGDHLQAIYGWAGSDGSLFANYPVAKEEELPISYRCLDRILDFGDSILRAGGRPARAFRANQQGGEVTSVETLKALGNVKADEDTLVLARTNDFAAEVARRLTERGIPWKPIKGPGGFHAPARAAGVQAILDLRAGKQIDGTAVWHMLKLMSSKVGTVELWAHGCKTFFDDKDKRSKMAPLDLASLEDAGATGAFRKLVASEHYKTIFKEEPARIMATAAERHGAEVAMNPRVRVGTTHASKGMEADHVVAVNHIPYPTVREIATKTGMDEERLVWYVTCTRARNKLTIAEGDGDRFPFVSV
jgi:superfamily I DNA/RNA helicase